MNTPRPASKNTAVELTEEQVARAAELAKVMDISHALAEDIIATGSGHGCLHDESDNNGC